MIFLNALKIIIELLLLFVILYDTCIGISGTFREMLLCLYDNIHINVPLAKDVWNRAKSRTFS